MRLQKNSKIFTRTLKNNIIKKCFKNHYSEVLRIFIYTRLKINKKLIFVQVSSPEACFISKIQQFELSSFHRVWHQNRNAVSLKKVSPLDFPQYNHFKYNMFKRTYASYRVKRKSFYRKSELRVFFLIFGGHIGAPKQCTNMVSPYKALQRCVKCFGK